MNLLYTLISFVFATFVLATPVDTDVLQTRQQSEVPGFISLLEETFQDPSVFKRDYPPLTMALTTLNQSGQGVAMVHIMYSNPATQGIVINAVENYINATSLTSILNYADDSNLAVDIVMVFFTNPDMIPGVLKIVKQLRANGVISFKKRFIGQIIGVVLDTINGVLTAVQNTALQTIINLMNSVTNPVDLYESLQKSGLAISILEDIVTTDDGQDFTVTLVTDIINDEIITWSSLINAVTKSGIVGSVASKLFTNSTDRSIIISWVLSNGLSLLLQLIEMFF